MIITTNPLYTQVGGSHYTRCAIQPFEYSIRNRLGGAEHTVIKYVTRWRHKNGIEDLRKARHTLDILIALEEKIQAEQQETEETDAALADFDREQAEDAAIAAMEDEPDEAEEFQEWVSAQVEAQRISRLEEAAATDGLDCEEGAMDDEVFYEWELPESEGDIGPDDTFIARAHQRA